MLQLVVQHANNLDNLSVFRLLRVSSAVRAALQQGTGRLRLGHRHTPALDSLAQVTSFGAWLPGHCGLVSELNVLVQGPHAIAGSSCPAGLLQRKSSPLRCSCAAHALPSLGMQQQHYS